MNMQDLVSQIMNEFPETKGNDRMLCYRVYEKIAKENGQGIFIPFNLFRKFPAFETISRIRRKLNEEKQIAEIKVGIMQTKSMSLNTAPNSWMAE